MKGENDGAETGSLSKGGQQQKTRATRGNTRRGGGGGGENLKVAIFNLSRVQTST